MPPLFAMAWGPNIAKELRREGFLAWITAFDGDTALAGEESSKAEDLQGYRKWLLDYWNVRTILEGSLGNHNALLYHPRYLGLAANAPILARYRILKELLLEMPVSLAPSGSTGPPETVYTETDDSLTFEVNRLSIQP